MNYALSHLSASIIICYTSNAVQIFHGCDGHGWYIAERKPRDFGPLPEADTVAECTRCARRACNWSLGPSGMKVERPRLKKYRLSFWMAPLQTQPSIPQIVAKRAHFYFSIPHVISSSAAHSTILPSIFLARGCTLFQGLQAREAARFAPRAPCSLLQRRQL